MEEAIHLGDTIAVMDKGKLLQCATPAEIIANPATPFVAELIGTASARSGCCRWPRSADHIEAGDIGGEPIEASASLRDAYAELLWSGRPALPVRRDGQIVGQVTLNALSRLAARPQ
jgi:osmoprotectant transport system ATP-binding protein